MKNIDEKILMADEEIKQLQNKRKKLLSEQKSYKKEKREIDAFIEKGAVFESIFTESKNLTKDEFYPPLNIIEPKYRTWQYYLKIKYSIY